MAFASASSFSFGAPAPSQPATSLFGAPPATPSLFGAPAAPAASMFGGLAPAAPAGGLFGSTAAKPAFSFGASAPAAAPAPSLFGQPAAPGGLFGQAPAAPAPTGFGGGLFGNSTQVAAPAQLQQSQVAAGPALTKSSKFGELPEGVKKLVEDMDAFFRTQIQVSEELKTCDLGSEITKTTSLLQDYTAEATNVSNLLSQDARQCSEQRARLEVDLADLAKATAILEGFKNPQAKGAAAKSAANHPFEYFSRKADEFRERLGHYRMTMDQIQHQVDTSRGLARNPSAIMPTLEAQHASFMTLASSVAALDTQLKHLKDEYRLIWREKTGSVQDPFKRMGTIENRMEGVEIR